MARKYAFRKCAGQAHPESDDNDDFLLKFVHSYGMKVAIIQHFELLIKLLLIHSSWMPAAIGIKTTSSK